MIPHRIERTIAEISSGGKSAKRLTLTGWNGNPAKLDLRTWITDESGRETPGRGITLTDEEAQALADALQAYLTGD